MALLVGGRGFDTLMPPERGSHRTSADRLPGQWPARAKTIAGEEDRDMLSRIRDDDAEPFSPHG